MFPAGNWSENLRKFFSLKMLGWSGKVVQTKAGTYIIAALVADSVTLEGAVMDLHIAHSGINSSALQVACPPPGIGAKI
jgi:hypothetical protein